MILFNLLYFSGNMFHGPAKDLDLFAGETSVRRGLVETTRYPLYRYPFHLLNRIKKSRSSTERDPSCFHSIVLYS